MLEPSPTIAGTSNEELVLHGEAKRSGMEAISRKSTDKGRMKLLRWQDLYSCIKKESKVS
jgi:hypothetical protein